MNTEKFPDFQYANLEHLKRILDENVVRDDIQSKWCVYLAYRCFKCLHTFISMGTLKDQHNHWIDEWNHVAQQYEDYYANPRVDIYDIDTMEKLIISAKKEETFEDCFIYDDLRRFIIFRFKFLNNKHNQSIFEQYDEKNKKFYHWAKDFIEKYPIEKREITDHL